MQIIVIRIIIIFCIDLQDTYFKWSVQKRSACMQYESARVPGSMLQVRRVFSHFVRNCSAS